MDVKNVIVCPVNMARVAEVTAVPAASTTKLNASCVHRTGRGYTMVRLQETCTPEERNMKPSTHKKTSSRSCWSIRLKNTQTMLAVMWLRWQEWQATAWQDRYKKRYTSDDAKSQHSTVRQNGTSQPCTQSKEKFIGVETWLWHISREVYLWCGKMSKE